MMERDDADVGLEQLLSDWRAQSISPDDFQDLNERLRQDPQARIYALESAALCVALRSTAEFFTTSQDSQEKVPQSEAQIQVRSHSWYRGYVALVAAILLAACMTVWLSTAADSQPAINSIYIFTAEQPLLRLGDRAEITGIADSQIRIIQNDEDIELQLLHGSISNHIQTNSGPFRIQTPSGTVHVTGTEFTVSLLPKESLAKETSMKLRPFIVSVLSGSVLVSGAWGSSTVLAAEEHRFPPVPSPKTAEVTPQKVDLMSVDFTDTPILEAIEYIVPHQQHGKRIILDPNTVSKGVHVNLQVQDMPIKNILELIAWQNNLHLFDQDGMWFLTTHKSTDKQTYSIDITAVSDAIGKENIQTHFTPVIQALHTSSQTKEKAKVSIWNNVLVVHCDISTLTQIQALIQAMTTVPPRTKITPETVCVEGKWKFNNDNVYMEKSITFDLKEMPFIELIDVMKELTQCNIIVHNNIIENISKIPSVTLSMKKARVATALKWFSEVTGVSIRVEGKNVFFGGPEQPAQIRAYSLFGPVEEYDALCSVIKSQFPGTLGTKGEWFIRVKDVIIVNHEMKDLFQLLQNLNEDQPSDINEF